MSPLEDLRAAIRAHTLRDEKDVLEALVTRCPIANDVRKRAEVRASALVKAIRVGKTPGLMDVFLAEYGLSSEEGVALMCLAEALLRVPDTETIDALIEDKIAPSQWSAHLGRSNSPLVNASTWALMLTGKVLTEDRTTTAKALRGAVKRLGEPVIRLAVRRAMKELGGQFVLGETIEQAIERGRAKRTAGYTFSYDMLGEAAMTAEDADAFFDAYAQAIDALAGSCTASDIRHNPGISIKLSALHPRYEHAQRRRVLNELLPRARTLALKARAVGMGLNIDAEEADRLDLGLDVIETLLRDPELAGWDGFGVVVQAYSKRALPVIDWLHALAEHVDRKIMVRLVKGAYWDTEIKRAQVAGLADFPVFERKAATDVSYLCCAQRLLSLSDRIYPQFATHNAHSVASILELATDPSAFEFQRLHGMGEALHDQIVRQGDVRSRIYAPVGAHRDLLAYLVRRLLENGANSSFVNQLIDLDVPVSKVVADPFEACRVATSVVVKPPALYAPERENARGFDLHDPTGSALFDTLREPFRQTTWDAGPLLAGPVAGAARQAVRNPAKPDDLVGHLTVCAQSDIDTALSHAAPWQACAQERADVLRRAADLYQDHAGALFAVLAREAGKTPVDAVAELREAVDFLRYYAARGTETIGPARGLIACISPWNFPLAIFIGQIAAALAAGNGVLAKPAEPTGLVAWHAVRLLHEAGVPVPALQLLPGCGATVGARLAGSSALNGICFTGSTDTARTIHRSMAGTAEPTAPVIAETGGLNAMIVDSTALPEQAVKDIVASAFQSAGQRCSALRVLYLQEDIAKPFLAMLFGAMDELAIGDPWQLSTDIGPIINDPARQAIASYIDRARTAGRVMKTLPLPHEGCFVAPTVIGVDGIGDLEAEIFGPVLHVATFKAEAIDAVIEDINAAGYGLTFGLHTRIDDRVQAVSTRVRAGNVYINRNQIGAIVGSQPFGGEGLSGTGPKAGGPNYVARFARQGRKVEPMQDGPVAEPAKVQAALDGARPSTTALSTVSMPGPTGESNRLSEFGRGIVLCLGPGRDAATRQARTAAANGCAAVAVAPGIDPPDGIDGVLDPQALAHLDGFQAVVSFAPNAHLLTLRRVLAARPGPLVPLLAEDDFGRWCRIERHICVDTTATGGNASLLAEAS